MSRWQSAVVCMGTLLLAHSASAFDCDKCVTKDAQGAINLVQSDECLQATMEEGKNECNTKQKATVCPKSPTCQWANLEASIATSSGSFPPDKDMDNILGAGCRPVISQFIVEECVGLSKETLEADLCVGMTICDRDPFGSCKQQVEMICGATGFFFSFCSNSDGKCSTINSWDTKTGVCATAISNWDDASCGKYPYPPLDHKNDTYTPPKYEMSKTALFLHNSPRIHGDNKIKISGTNTEELAQLAIDAAYIGGPIVVLGVIMFLVLLVVFIAQACGGIKTCPCCPSAEKAKTKSGCCTSILVFFISVVFALVGGAIAFGGVHYLNLATVNIRNEVGDVSTLMDRMISVCTNGINTIGNAQVSVKELKDACPTLSDQMKEAENNLQGSNELLTKARGELSKLSGSLGGLNESSDDIFKNQYWGSVGVLCFCLFTILFTSFVVIGKQMCHMQDMYVKCLRKIFAVLAVVILILVLLSMILAGLLLAVNVVSADICADPVGVVGALTQGNEKINYYLTCEGNNDLIEEIQKAEDFLHDARAQLRTVKSTGVFVCPGAEDGGEKEFEAVEADLKDLTDVLKNEAEPFLKCKVINDIFSQFVYKHYCTDLMDALALLWTGFFIGSFFLFFLSISFKSATFNRRKHEEQLKKMANSEEVSLDPF